jgi:hypothetical protein
VRIVGDCIREEDWCLYGVGFTCNERSGNDILSVADQEIGNRDASIGAVVEDE